MKNIVKNRNFGLIIGIGAILLLAWILVPQFFKPSTLVSTIRNNCVFAFLACAEVLAIMAGNIDLSGPAILAAAGCLTINIHIANPELSIVVLVLIAIVFGLAIGAINGFLVMYLGMVPMIATLATTYILRGTAFYLTSQGITYYAAFFQEEYRKIGIPKTLGIHNVIWCAIVVFVITGILINRNTIGRRLLAIGTNRESARISGINVQMIGTIGYMISGAICGLAGVCWGANYTSVDSYCADGYEMTAICICLLGGAGDGEARISGLVLSTVLIAFMSAFISMLPGMSTWSDGIKGIMIVLAIALNAWTHKSTQKKELQERERRMA